MEHEGMDDLRPARPGLRPSPQLLEATSQVFRLLSELTRLQHLCQLKQGAMVVADLIESTGFSQSPISHQLGQLQRAGLESCERDGMGPFWSADNDRVDDLGAPAENRLRLEAQLQQLTAGWDRARLVSGAPPDVSFKDLDG